MEHAPDVECRETLAIIVSNAKELQKTDKGCCLVLLRLFAAVVDGDSKVQLKHVNKDEWKWCVQWLAECTKDRAFGE